MGANQSTATSQTVIENQTPIQFSKDVLNQLEDRLASPETSPERQSTLDAHIRSRIKSELSRLQQEEEDVRSQIEAALEKENLDHERRVAGDGASEDAAMGDTKSSTALLGDLEEIRGKIDRFQARRRLDDLPQVKAAAEAVVSCYNSHPKSTLECWREVQTFKKTVAEVEQTYFHSLQ